MALTYECPRGFQLVCDEEEGMKVSDVNQEGIELWLIKSPVDFDIRNLSGHKIKSKFSVQSGNDDNVKYVVKANTNTTELNSYQCLFRHNSQAETIKVGPKFNGQLDITKVYKMPSSVDVQIPMKTLPHIPSGLKQRYVPFGSRSPERISRKRKTINTEGEQEELTPGGKKKKKKHKKRKEEEDEEDSMPLVNDSQIPAELLVPDQQSEEDHKVTKHKKKKKKHKNESFTDLMQQP
ncbi:glutamic acid-rich protein-like isoform X1 [Argonauta hians]